MGTEKLNPRKEFWDSMHERDVYFECGSNYKQDIDSKYGIFKHPNSRKALMHMRLIDQDELWDGRLEPEPLLRDIEKNGKNWRVLDIGCGYGAHGSILAAFVEQYDGIDISSRMVNAGNNAISELGIENMSLTHVPDCDLSYIKDNSYDVVMSTAVFIHIDVEVTRHYFSETRRVLKDDGFFLHHLNVKEDGESEHGQKTWPEHYHHIYHVDELEEIINSSGMEILGHSDTKNFRGDAPAFGRWTLGRIKSIDNG